MGIGIYGVERAASYSALTAQITAASLVNSCDVCIVAWPYIETIVQWCLPLGCQCQWAENQRTGPVGNANWNPHVHPKKPPREKMRPGCQTGWVANCALTYTTPSLVGFGIRRRLALVWRYPPVVQECQFQRCEWNCSAMGASAAIEFSSLATSWTPIAREAATDTGAVSATATVHNSGVKGRHQGHHQDRKAIAIEICKS